MSQPISAKEVIAKSFEQTLVVGHRGAANDVPENTIASFKRAIEVGAVATECDVHMSSDGHAVVIHDKTLLRTFRKPNIVARTPAAKLRQWNVPLLDDYIKACKGKIVQVIEIKAGEGVVEESVRMVKAHGTEDETIFFSFSRDFIRKTKELMPEVICVWLSSSSVKNESQREEQFHSWQELGVDGIGYSFGNATGELVNFWRGKRVPMFVWTVPPGKDVEKLHRAKVNFVITNHPKEVKEQLAHLTSG